MKVEIYGADWCSTCKNAIDICKNSNVDFEYKDVDDSKTLKELEDKLGNKVRSVPQIFVDGQHLKLGLTELQQRVK